VETANAKGITFSSHSFIKQAVPHLGSKSKSKKPERKKPLLAAADEGERISNRNISRCGAGKHH